MSAQPWALPRAKARAKARRRPPKRPWSRPACPWWLSLLACASAFAWYARALRDGDWFGVVVDALVTLFWAGDAWLWWRWRQWCRHSGGPFPRCDDPAARVVQGLVGLWLLYTAVRFL